MKTGRYGVFLLKIAIYAIAVLIIIIATNYFIDASSAINPRYDEMARLALEGNIVAVPQNYNERAYQICIVEQMDRMPETIVIGNSRGMFLGTGTTGYEDIYNHCVSNACLEDDYAMLGLYYKKFGALPSRVIMEAGPWFFFEDNPEARWRELGTYTAAAVDLYGIVNGGELYMDVKAENPYLSLSYFQYNLGQFLQKGFRVFDRSVNARISTNEDEGADYPDGTIRYEAHLERESEERLKSVQQTTGACTQANIQFMTEISEQKAKAFENLIDYLLENNCEVTIYLQPFSVTQCRYSLDQGLNPAFELVEHYLWDLAQEKGIRIVGGYDARDFGLTDERFIDSIHLDRIGTGIVWNYEY